MMTLEEIRGSLPERLQKYELPPVLTNINDANLMLAYTIALYQERCEQPVLEVKSPSICPKCGTFC